MSDHLCVDQVESLGGDRSQMIEGARRIESGYVVVDAELGSLPKEVLKMNDNFHFKVSEKDKWTAASILGRPGKSIGKHKYKNPKYNA